MEDVEHEEGSSSQKDNTVTEYRRGAEGKVRIGLSDGSSFFVSEASEICGLLRLECVVDASLLAALENESARFTARMKAIELLSRREHSGRELQLKLKKRGFDAEVIAVVVEDLCREGYIDDFRYAELWAASRLRRHPEGRHLLSAGLRKRGIDRQIIAQVLDDLLTEEVVDAALAQALEKIRRNRTLDPDYLMKKMSARGFSYRQIQAHLQNLK
ncbi:MAG: regulatory protein RecX [Spirochaetales bacterium]|jgi:regulatory protein|nr:regulatory protein RecX [Spirochaetales bacterium]